MLAPTTSEADIIFNRANVALAKSQRLIASWLPPRTEEELRNAKSEEEIEREEQEMFAPVPELLGLGAPVPQEIKNGDERRQELSSNDKLRKQLLGKEFAKLYGKTGSATKKDFGALPLGSKPRPVVTKQAVEEEMEEDAGRSSLGKPKRRVEASSVEGEEQEEQGDDKGSFPRPNTRIQGSISSKKRTSTYLDEVLAEKSRKRKKKKGGVVPIEGKVTNI
ncbi:hypothetical protein MMC11_004711 [Xylographa trunciseda]|nr:hypothetical protein [Xylographa trunciseda]